MGGSCTTGIFSSSASLPAVPGRSSISSQTNSGMTKQICKRGLSFTLGVYRGTV